MTPERIQEIAEAHLSIKANEWFDVETAMQTAIFAAVEEARRELLEELRPRLRDTCAWCKGNIEVGDHTMDCPVYRERMLSMSVDDLRAEVDRLRAVIKDAIDGCQATGYRSDAPYAWDAGEDLKKALRGEGGE